MFPRDVDDINLEELVVPTGGWAEVRETGLGGQSQTPAIRAR